ncbi:hypothetical protein MTR67_039952 [Solanum verrucosum]|uniref:Uncharacterized protein n=1 Tax=Solanum verrucosum TaxID=315347 RepID=A0AAF0UI52_SOLVR|nr:hypothetical protein MTR67_039952 [Solanum verrucosum]
MFPQLHSSAAKVSKFVFMEIIVVVICTYQIRLQLETLLAEKARLGQENSVLTRENRFLREIVEYHQLTMQDVVYLDENSEEVTEVYPIKVVSPQVTKDNSSHPVSSLETKDVSCDITSLSSFIQIPAEGDLGRH